MLRSLGIAGRLFLAFAAIAALALASGGVGWWMLSNIETAQKTIAERSMPAVADARAVAEISTRLIARGPLLTNATNQGLREAVADQLFGQVEQLDALLDRIESYGDDAGRVGALRAVARELLAKLREQDLLVARRIDLTERITASIRRALAAANGLSDLSETLVANAASSTTAVISNLYELVEAGERIEESLEALDRLVEVDVFLLERMFELRLRASQVGLLLNQVSRSESVRELGGIETTVQGNLRILKRRVAGIADPVRHEQAGTLFQQLIVASQGDAGNVFRLRREILSVEQAIAGLTEQILSHSESLNGFVVQLVEDSKALADRAAAEAGRAVEAGLITLVLQSIVFLAVAGLIVWFYVQRNVVRRLQGLAGVMQKLAEGDLKVAVPTGGHDELSDMAETVRFFKEQAVVKRELELEREQTTIELRRHKSELESLVEERTVQLTETNRRLTEEVENHDRARERAERANRAKSEFLAAMSHEIRTPMSGILGMLRILGDSALTAEQRERLGVIRSSSQTLLGILNDILDYSKIESGKVDLEVSDFDLQQLVDDIMTVMRFRATEKGLRLTADFDPGVPAVVRADPGKLSQVLLNLIGNGLKFTEAGDVSLRVSRDEDSAQEGPDSGFRLRFDVADSGIGIAPAAQAQLFDAFYQVDQRRSRRQGGTGLGLAISRRLVAAMGGGIAVESAVGKGSCFSFTARVEPGDAEAIADPDVVLPQLNPDLGSRRVLLVEDNEINAIVVETFLEKMGHRVSLATSGEQALESLAEQVFELILMDISLPGISGLETARRIRASEGGTGDGDGRRVPIIAMSAHVFRDEIAQHLEVGMDAFVGKPVAPERLAEAMAQVLLQPAKRVPPTAPAPVAGPLSDGSTLEEDFRVLGRERTRRMVEAFLEATGPKVERLEAAVEAGDWPALAQLAHSLKGSAASLGLPALEDRSRDLETAAKAEDQAAMDVAFAGYRSLCEASLAVVQQDWNALCEAGSRASVSVAE